MTLRQFCEQAIASGHPKYLWTDEGDDFTPEAFLTREEYTSMLDLEVQVEDDRLITFGRKGNPLVGSELYFNQPKRSEDT
jgi:hypothetical protein